MMTTTETTTWWQRAHADSGARIPYFSMEFALSAELPIYSGGLGVLAGAHLKAAAELGSPRVGVGLLSDGGCDGAVEGAALIRHPPLVARRQRGLRRRARHALRRAARGTGRARRSPPALTRRVRRRRPLRADADVAAAVGVRERRL